jgi:small subunit ribosomal protein S1
MNLAKSFLCYVISLPYGVEGFATPKHLVKEDGSQAKIEEKLQFKVIEFNKEARRINGR